MFVIRFSDACSGVARFAFGLNIPKSIYNLEVFQIEFVLVMIVECVLSIIFFTE